MSMNIETSQVFKLELSVTFYKIMVHKLITMLNT